MNYMLDILLLVAVVILMIEASATNARIRRLEAKAEPNEWDAIGWGPEELD